jgi:hypothetical protein
MAHIRMSFDDVCETSPRMRKTLNFIVVCYTVQDGDTARGLSPSSGISASQLQGPSGSARNAAILGSTFRIALNDSGMQDSDGEE